MKEKEREREQFGEKKEEGKSRERVIDKDGEEERGMGREDKNVVTCGGKRDSGHRRWVSSVEIGGGGEGGYDDLEAIGDGVGSTDGWMVVGWLGGWLSAGSKGGAHSSFRGTVALGG